MRNMLEKLGSKLNGDGRPTVRASARDLTARLLAIDEGCMVAPAHIRIPWYGMLGSKSGFDALDALDALEECFEDKTPLILAVETGLSSDPYMNWGVPALAGKTIVSFSDAHSLPNMGRELTVSRQLWLPGPGRRAEGKPGGANLRVLPRRREIPPDRAP